MPVKACEKDGRPGYKWGDEGVCYTYPPENESLRVSARAKALQQGRAIQARRSSAPGYRPR